MEPPTITVEELGQLWWRWYLGHPRLVEAFNLAFAYSGSGWRNFATTAFLNRVHIFVDEWGRHVPSDAIACYFSTEKDIWVSPRLLDEPLEVIAAVLAHELVHAVEFHDPNDDPGSLIEQEMEAEYHAAHVYSCVPHGERQTKWTMELNELLTYIREDRHAEWVIRSATWQKYAFGRVLKNPE